MTAALFAGTAFSMFVPLPASAEPPRLAEPTAAGAADTGAQIEPDNNGTDYTRPQNSFDLRGNYRDSSGPSSRTRRDGLILRLTRKIDLNAGWKLAIFAQVPVEAKSITMFGPPSTDHRNGLGNAEFQAALSHAIDERWAFGFGVRLEAPTAVDNTAEQWQIMPGLGVRYSLPELGPDSYFVPVIRYALKLASNSAGRNVSEPQIAPTFNVGLPDRWFVTFYPSNDIRINFGAPVSGQTGRLFLPFDVALGKTLSDDLVVSLEVSVPIIKNYPVYDFKSELRLVAKY